MDKKLIARELVKIAKDLTASFSSEQIREWDKFFDWVKKRYRKSSVTQDTEKPGAYIWEKEIYINGERQCRLKSAGYEGSYSGIRREFLVWGGGSHKIISTKDGATIPFNQMKKLWLGTMSEEEDEKMKSGGSSLTPKRAEYVKKLIEQSMSVVREMLSGVRLKAYSYGPQDYRTRVFAVGLWDDMRDKFFNVSYVVEESIFGLTILGTRYEARNLNDFLKLLKKTKTLVRTELKRLGPYEAASLTGKEISPVRSFKKPKVDFETVDEWLRTTLEIPLILTTSSTVPQREVEKWLRENLTDIMKKVPSKTPPTPEGRGMEYDEPSGNVDFVPPDRININNAEINFYQNGNKGTLILDTRVR